MKNLKRLLLILLLSVSTLQAQSRSDIQVLIDAIATGTPNTALKVRTVLNAIANGTMQSGDIVYVDCSNAYITANFDGTGLGINQRIGWAICNGNNGTRNWNGKVPVAYGSSYLTMGATGGEVMHTLTVNEMPAHNHTISNQSNGVSGGGKVTVGNESPEGTNPITDNTGGGAAHNNMQPYTVVLAIMKL